MDPFLCCCCFFKNLMLSFQLKFHLSKEYPLVFTFARIFAQQVVNCTERELSSILA